MNQLETEADYARLEQRIQREVEESNQQARDYAAATSVSEVQKLYEEYEPEEYQNQLLFTEKLATAAIGMNDRGEYQQAQQFIEQILDDDNYQQISPWLYVQLYVAASENGKKPAADLRTQAVNKLYEAGFLEEQSDPGDEYFFGIEEDG